MKERKLKTSEKSAAAKTEKAYSDELAKTLDDSYQRGTLDRTYTSQMTYELTVLKSKLTKLQRSTKSKELTEFGGQFRAENQADATVWAIIFGCF